MDRFRLYDRGTGATSSTLSVPSNRSQFACEHNSQPSSQGSVRMQVVIGSSTLEPPSPATYDEDDNDDDVVVDDDDDDDELGKVVVTNHKQRAWKPATAGARIPCGVVASSSASAPRSKTALKRTSAAAPLPLASSSFDIPIQQQQPKKRGRPKGWKPGMPYSTTSDRPVSDAAKLAKEKYLRENPGVAAVRGRPRGRPPKRPLQTTRQLLDSLERRYVRFICEWKGCKAELQNMDTLRRHVYKVHGRDEVCQWSTCVGAESPRIFATNDEFIHHIENLHLVPFQWHMGFGYSNEKPVPPNIKASKDTTVPAYLLDEKGKQVTPWIREIEVEDEVTRLARRRKLRLVLQWMNDEAPLGEDEDSEEEASD